MKKLTWFYLPGCPYCAMADRALRELRAENPDYAAVELEAVDETADPARAARYDYYFTPTFFLGEEKLYEARPGTLYPSMLKNVRRALDAAREQKA